MKKYLFLFLVLISTYCFSQKYHVDKTVTHGDSITYLRSTMAPLNGTVYNEFGDICTYLNGKKNGLYREWFKTGQLKHKGNYINGKDEGEFFWWYENGQLSWKGKRLRGKNIGLWRGWHENGNIMSEDHFENNLYNGVSKRYFENGSLKSEKPYTNEKIHGISKKYYENGKIESISNWINGKPKGIQRYWFPNGNLKQEGFIKGFNENEYPIFNGSLKKYRKDGSLYCETIYDKTGKQIKDQNFNLNSQPITDKEFYSTPEFLKR
jgi:antitoxin component YwqK of YwqJK toxin-antitoxin module